MKKFTEELGRNYHTLDPDPIDFFHDERVDVEIFPSSWGDFSVSVSVPDLNYNSGLRQYSTEEEANTFARNEYTQLVTKLNNATQIEERILIKVLEHLQGSSDS